MSRNKIRLLIVDDHELVRTGLATVLGYEKDFRIVGTASTGLEALNQAERTPPDVVIMDLMMPELDGASATERLLEICPAARVLVLTSFGTGQELRRAFAAGASGVLLKSVPNQEIAAAVRQIAAGHHVIPDEIAHELQSAPHAGLTPRQIDILHGITQGRSNKEISKMVGISVAGIKKHIGLIFHKLGVSTRSEAAATAMRHKLVKF